MKPLPVPRIKRSVMRGADWGVFLVSALALFIAANYIAQRYYHRWDITASRSFSISEQSKKILKEVKSHLGVVVFIAPGDELYGKIKDLLSAYESACPLLKVEYIDPDRQRERMELLAKKFNVTRPNLVVFECGDQSKFVEKDQMVEYDFSGMQYGMQPKVKAFKAEEAFTNAISQVLSPAKPVIYFTTGHAERSGESQSGAGFSTIKSRLEKEGATLKDWESLGKDTVPADCNLLVVGGPARPFDPREAELIGSYLEKGGKALLLLDPLVAEGKNPDFMSDGLEEMLSKWGVTPEKDLIVDPDKAVPYMGAQTFFLTDFGNHTTVEDLKSSKLPVLASLAISLKILAAPEGYSVQPLMRTSAGAWGERDLTKLDNVGQDPTDTAGPMVVAAAVSFEDKGKAARLVVVGDSDFASDEFMQAQWGNSMFCLNCIHWLLSQESKIAVPPKVSAETKLNLTKSQGNTLFVLFVVVLPAAILSIGFRVYLKRRR